MKIGYAILDQGTKATVIIREGKALYPQNNAFSCLFEDSSKVISAIDEISSLKMKEVQIKKFLAPVYPEKIFLPAVNFRSHSKESSMNPPKEPYFFTKFRNTLVGVGDPIIIPPYLNKVDYEGEIGVVIGKRCRDVDKERAIDCVFGFTITNDVSFRDYQFPGIQPYGLNWVKGKGLDYGMPIGPWIVTKDEIDLNSLRIITRVNGKKVQDGAIDDMIFDIPSLISYISKGITLKPGDIITTGTPAGVGEFGDKNYLKHGDIVSVEVPQIGVLWNKIEVEPLESMKELT